MNAYLGLALKSPVSFVLAEHERLTAIRRDLHAHPEIGFEEHRTGALVAERLHQWGVEVHTGVGRTGVVGVIRGRRDASGKAVGLRADMNALPMQEENEFAHRSTKPGLMHGSGHDGHTTMLLGAAQYLANTRNFDGTVYLIFQPGEEGFAGAKAMIDDGLFVGLNARERTSMGVFQNTWARAESWGLLVLNPGELPATAAEEKFVEAALGLEKAKQAAAAVQGYRSALNRWPHNLAAMMGIGNSYFALGDLRNSEAAFRIASQAYPEEGAASNNLAHVLLELGRREEALAAAQRAVSLGGPHQSVFQKTLQEIQAAAR